MNQDQMREALAEFLVREMPAGTVIGDPEWWAPKIMKALSHVNETPKNEHDSDDVLTKARNVNHIGDANKMVRLTEMELWRNDELMALNAEFGLLFPDVQRFANAIMDAMIAKNAPRERITREQVQSIIERLGKVSDHGWTFSDMALMALISEIEDLI